MQKLQFKIQLDAATVANLDRMGDKAGKQSGNTFSAMVLTEIARIAEIRGDTLSSADVWGMLSRISEELESAQPEPAPLPAPPPKLKRGRTHLSAVAPAMA